MALDIRACTQFFAQGRSEFHKFALKDGSAGFALSSVVVAVIDGFHFKHAVDEGVFCSSLGALLHGLPLCAARIGGVLQGRLFLFPVPQLFLFDNLLLFLRSLLVRAFLLPLARALSAPHTRQYFTTARWELAGYLNGAIYLARVLAQLPKDVAQPAHEHSNANPPHDHQVLLHPPLLFLGFGVLLATPRSSGRTYKHFSRGSPHACSNKTKQARRTNTHACSRGGVKDANILRPLPLPRRLFHHPFALLRAPQVQADVQQQGNHY